MLNYLDKQIPFHVYPDIESLSDVLARKLVHLIRTSIFKNQICHMVFPGGNSLHWILKYFRKQEIPWDNLHVYPSDERCVSVGDVRRNDQTLRELLFGKAPIPLKNLHPIPAELGPEEGAGQYCQLLNRTPMFDIALLGLGIDGHTASLFPGSVALTDNRSAVPIYNAPKLPRERVSIGLSRLQQARERWIIAAGSEKRVVLQRIQRGENLPVVQVRPTAFFVDANAEPVGQ